MIVVGEEWFALLRKHTPAHPVIGPSGYTLNMPLGLQVPPPALTPEFIAEIQAERTAAGIKVEDDLLPDPDEHYEEEDAESFSIDDMIAQAPS